MHQVRGWYSGAAAYFGWMREAKRENTRCGLRPMSDKATGRKTRGPEGCDENGPAAALLLGHVPIQGIHAGDINDFSFAPLYHRLSRELRKQKTGIQVRLDYLIPILWSLVEHTRRDARVRPAYSRVVDQNADGPNVY